MMPGLFQAEDAIGTVHYSRFTVLSDKTLLFLGDFDGEFSELMAGLAKTTGQVFDAIFRHMDNPPPTPVAVKKRPNPQGAFRKKLLNIRIPYADTSPDCGSEERSDKAMPSIAYRA
jgi:hypothetical protein